MSFLERKARRPFDPNCAGPGQCHGCVVWCNVCGDTSRTCHAKERCDTHQECEHGVTGRTRESPGGCPACDREEEFYLLARDAFYRGKSRPLDSNNEAREP